jgi:hypothetical protein
MHQRSLLVMASAVQLAAGVVGNVVAVREGRAFDIALLGWRGDPDRVSMDSWLLGTGWSAPVAMLAAQGVATARLAKGPSTTATRCLGVLGAAMTAGYLVEREFRTAVTPQGWRRTVSPVCASGFGLAFVMAVLGLRRTPPPR